MVRKSVAVWILGSLTFLAGIHVIDGFLWFTGFQNASILLQLYPFGEITRGINSVVYLVCTFMLTFGLWGGTTFVALRNPIETFLGKVLDEGNRENPADIELLEARTSILEMIGETLENNSKRLAGLEDLVLSVRSEVLSLESLDKRLEALTGEVKSLKEISKLLKKSRQSRKERDSRAFDVLPAPALSPYYEEALAQPVTTQAYIDFVLASSAATGDMRT